MSIDFTSHIADFRPEICEVANMLGHDHDYFIEFYSNALTDAYSRTKDYNASVFMGAMLLYRLHAENVVNNATPDEIKGLSKELSSIACDAPECGVLQVNPFTAKPFSQERGSAYRKASDPKTFARFFRVEERKAKEMQNLKARKVGKGADKYASAYAVESTKQQQQKNKAFLENNYVYDHLTGEARTLASVSKTDDQKTAKRLAFLNAMQRLADEQGLSWAMLTLTLPAEYHPNPANGRCAFNGVGFDEQQRILSKKWANVRAMLAKDKLTLSGVRVHEPQADGTPHQHILFFYKDESQLDLVIRAVLTHFPDKTRIRRTRTDAAGYFLTGAKGLEFDVKVFENLEAYDSGVVYKTLGASAYDPNKVGCLTQFDVGAKKLAISDSDSPAVRERKETNNRKVMSFASYVMKYVNKSTLDESDSDSFVAVVANRAVWGIRSFALFGMPSISEKWDLLRQIDLKDKEIVGDLRALASMAQQADDLSAYDLLRTLGGLSVAPLVPLYSLAALSTAAVTRYGEKTRKSVGIAVINLGTEEQTAIAVKSLTKSIESAASVAALQSMPLSERSEVVGQTRFATQLVYLGLSVTSELPGNSNPFLVQSRDASASAQRKAATAAFDRSHCLIAAAGAGKTHTLVERVKHMLAHGISVKSILVFSFTKDSARELSSRLNAAGLRGVSCTTMHSKAAKLLESLGSSVETGQDFDQCLRDVIQVSTERGDILKGKFHILVDESQDLNSLNYEFVEYLAKTFYLVGDFRQSIYRWRGATPDAFAAHAKALQSQNQTSDLFDNASLGILTTFRNTHAVNAFANAIAYTIDQTSEFSSSLDTAEFGKVEKELVSNEEQEYQSVREYLLNASTHATLKNAVLARTRKLLQFVKSRLRIDLTEEQFNQIEFSTTHASKGLQFYNVVIVNGSRTEIEDDKEFANIAYVAVTRAAGNVLLTSVGQLPDIFVKAEAYLSQFQN